MMLVETIEVKLEKWKNDKTKWGLFPELCHVEFINERQVRLLRDFYYIRPDGLVMMAPKDFICDGASIPKVLWPIADSPFTGNNLRPALIHDYYCFLGRQNQSTWKSSDIHYMFHQGLRLEGESSWKARPKWLTVKTFGPRFKAKDA